MFNFDQPKLKLGVAYTRRDTWMNKETESNKNDIIKKVSILAKLQDIEIFSTEDLEVKRKTMMIAGREIRRSNNKYMTDYEDAISVVDYFKEKEIDALFIPFSNYGQEEAVATAEQINKVENYRDPDSFADIVRGMHLYGRKILRPQGLVTARYNAA